MSRRLSSYSFDELLLMPKERLESTLRECVESIRKILDPEGDIKKEIEKGKATNNNLLNKHYGTNY